MVFDIFDHIFFWNFLDFYAPVSLLILNFPNEYIDQKCFFFFFPLGSYSWYLSLLSYFRHFTMVLTTTYRLILQKVDLSLFCFELQTYISNYDCPSSPRCSLAISNLITTNLTHESHSLVNSSFPRVPMYLVFWWYHIQLTTEVRNLEVILDSIFDSSKSSWLTILIVFVFQVPLGNAASLHELAYWLKL